MTCHDIGPEISAGPPYMITTGLSPDECAVLTRTGNAIRVSDPRLASLMDIFGRLYHAEEMPPMEHLATRDKRRRRWVPRGRSRRPAAEEGCHGVER